MHALSIRKTTANVARLTTKGVGKLLTASGSYTLAGLFQGDGRSAEDDPGHRPEAGAGDSFFPPVPHRQLRK